MEASVDDNNMKFKPFKAHYSNDNNSGIDLNGSQFAKFPDTNVNDSSLNINVVGVSQKTNFSTVEGKQSVQQSDINEIIPVSLSASKSDNAVKEDLLMKSEATKASNISDINLGKVDRNEQQILDHFTINSEDSTIKDEDDVININGDLNMSDVAHETQTENDVIAIQNSKIEINRLEIIETGVIGEKYFNDKMGFHNVLLNSHYKLS